MAQHGEHDHTHRDPITGAPGAHPGGVAVGGVAGGALAGAAAGTVFGPIGTLIGAGIGVVAGASAGKAIAERIDPTRELDYWRDAHASRPYARSDRDFDLDYAPAYDFGLQTRERHQDRDWTQVEPDLAEEWGHGRATSRLEWNEAREPARDAWMRADSTYRAYSASDAHFESRFEQAHDREPGDTFEEFRPAYRYGTWARTHHRDRDWDDALEDDLRAGWERAKGSSKLGWQRARNAVREAFDHDESRSGEPRYAGSGAQVSASRDHLAPDVLTSGTGVLPTGGRTSDTTTRSGIGPGTDRGF